MRKAIILAVIFSIFVGYMFGSTSFSFRNTEWSAMYSERWENMYFMGIIGTSGFGVAGGYITTIPIRKKVGFLNTLVGKSTYAIALGMNLTQNVPTAYFKYELSHILAPFIYDIQLTAGNYGLPNFGIGLDGSSYLTLLGASLYAREHYKLVFQTYMENFGLMDVSYKNMKATLMFTDEVGPVFLQTVGLSLGAASFDIGVGYNGNLGLNFGISSAKSDMNHGWWLRYMNNDFSSTFLCDVHLDESELIIGYNRGAVYVSLER